MDEKKVETIKIWGYVKNQEGNILKHINVILLKKIKSDTKSEYIPIQNTMTNENGIYVFEIEQSEGGLYKVIVLGQNRKEKQECMKYLI